LHDRAGRDVRTELPGIEGWGTHDRMLRTLFILALIGCGGCARYFRVTEPNGSREYYTTPIEDQPGEAIKFSDMRTNSRITLQSSDVKEIKQGDLPPDLQPK
jgi:hypothetical protein